MSKVEIRSAREIWMGNKAIDEKEEGRIPTFLGSFEHKGVRFDFDHDVLQGGMFRGVIIVSGFPGQGKTSTSVQMAVRQAEAGYKVLYISLEQDALEIIEKVLGLLSGDSFKRWEDIKFQNPTDFERQKQLGLELIDLYLGDRLKLTHTSIKPKEMIELVDAQKENFDIMYCDNFQNIEVTPGKEVEELKFVSNSVMQIINNYKKCAFVWLSQLTDKYSQDPLKATINFSSKLVHDAVLRLVVYNQIHEEKKKGDAPVVDVDKAYIGVLKNRKSQSELRENKCCVFTFDNVKGRLGSFVLPSVKEKKQQMLKANSIVKTDEEMIEVTEEVPVEMNELNEIDDIFGYFDQDEYMDDMGEFIDEE